MGRIPQEALDNLKKYSYKAVDKSLLSRYIMNYFWAWAAALFPLNMAPNTITLCGLIIVFFNFLTLIYYDPMYLTENNGAEGPPHWVYYTWGIGLFLYQTLDAVDGKQARRTGMAGPLGELFDHGCDAINTTLGVVLGCRALNLGRSWWTVSSQVATLANFYLTTWEEYHTGLLYLGYFSGPVDGLMIIIFFFFISGYFGPTFWDRGIWSTVGVSHLAPFKNLPDLPLNESFMVFGALGLGMNILQSYINVRKASRRRGQSTLRPLALLFPFVVPTVIQIAWLAHPRFNDSWIIDSGAFVPFLCAWGLQFAHQVGRMIVAHITSTPFPVYDWIWIWSFIGALDANLPALGIHPVFQTSAKKTTIFVWVTLVISLAAYGRFVTLMIQDITEYLGVACFTVRKRDENGVWRDARPGAKFQ